MALKNEHDAHQAAAAAADYARLVQQYGYKAAALIAAQQPKGE